MNTLPKPLSEGFYRCTRCGTAFKPSAGPRRLMNTRWCINCLEPDRMTYTDDQRSKLIILTFIGKL